MATSDDDQVLNLEKTKEKNKPYGDQDKDINRDFFILVIKTL
jgi:hypothetical protein